MTTHQCPKTKAAILDGQYVEGCNQCLNTVTHSADYAAKWRRERSKEDHRQDIVQRYDGDKINKEWVQLYESKAREALGDAKVEEILRQ